MLGFEVQVFAMVGLSSQAEADLVAFEELCDGWPLVRECHMLNGEIDFILKCVAPDLSTFQSFLTGLADGGAERGERAHVAGDPGAKDAPGVPFDVMEDRLSQSA
jgi:DNA-binding Lrp family transcriptional regulator